MLVWFKLKKVSLNFTEIDNGFWKVANKQGWKFFKVKNFNGKVY